MKFAIFSGHSQLKNGTMTGAKGILNETIENELVAKAVHKYLEQAKVDSDLFIVPRKTLSSKTSESNYKLPKANATKYDCVVEIHFNAHKTTSSAMGTECLYMSSKGKEYAQRVNDRLDDVFKDRQVKHRDDLYMLTQTTSPAIIVEVCFVDSESDANIYKKHGADAIGKLIAEGLINKKIEEPKQGLTLKNGSYNKKVRVIADSLNVRRDRTTNHAPLGALKKGDEVVIWYSIDNWASISWVSSLTQDNTGYINCKYVEFV